MIRKTVVFTNASLIMPPELQDKKVVYSIFGIPFYIIEVKKDYKK